MNTAINKFSVLYGDQLEEHLSQFLINSWSFSGVSTFARNEKEFERRYIYREPSRKSATTVAGTAYHAALESFFSALKEGELKQIAELQECAYKEIDKIEANEWKLGKKTPSVTDCINTATKTVNALIENFYKEHDLYLANIARVVAVEESFECWLIVNGVDIPLPCRGKLDLVVELTDGRRIIIDHKSKSAYTDESELAGKDVAV